MTLLLVEVAPDGSVTALNCGHPWPYRIARTAVAPVAPADPMPPLGLFPLPAGLPAVCCGQLRPGEGLFLHTDGAADARDAAGEFFPLTRELRSSVEAAAAPGGPSPTGVVGRCPQGVAAACGRTADGRCGAADAEQRPGAGAVAVGAGPGGPPGRGGWRRDGPSSGGGRSVTGAGTPLHTPCEGAFTTLN